MQINSGPKGDAITIVAMETDCNDQVPYFNAPIYLENISQIGKVDEILGAITNVVSIATACFL